jgi:hypothetical protein
VTVGVLVTEGVDFTVGVCVCVGVDFVVGVNVGVLVGGVLVGVCVGGAVQIPATPPRQVPPAMKVPSHIALVTPSAHVVAPWQHPVGGGVSVGVAVGVAVGCVFVGVTVGPVPPGAVGGQRPASWSSTSAPVVAL